MRFLKWLLTVFLLTVFATAMTFGVWALINSFTTHADHDLVYATIKQADPPVPVTDKKKGLFKDTYVVNYVQTLTVNFNYNGQTYTSARDFTVHSEKSDVPVSTGSGLTYNLSPYKKGVTIQIYVNKNNPEIFSLAGDSNTSVVSLKKVCTFSIPIYAIVLIIYTISYIGKCKKERKQAFLDKYMSTRY